MICFINFSPSSQECLLTKIDKKEWKNQFKGNEAIDRKLKQDLKIEEIH